MAAVQRNSKVKASVLEKIGSGQRDKLVKDIVEIEDFYRSQLLNKWSDIARWWKLYYAKREDHRASHEKWRANVFLPLPYQGVEARVAQLVDALTSADPMIQAEGVGDEDYEAARHGERLLEYSTRGMQLRKQLTTILRASSVQGTDFYKSVWREQAHAITVFPTKGEIEYFQSAIEDVVATGIAPPPDFTTDPEAFAKWREVINKSESKIKIPEPPTGGKKVIVKYRGPYIDRIPIDSLRFDPLIQEIQDQHCFIQRIVVPRQWLLERTGKGEQFPYDPAEVEKGLEGWDGRRLEDLQDEISQELGYTSGSVSDPYFEDGVELFEVWKPRSEFPFQIVLNRRSIINKRLGELPYMHGEVSITAIRNVLAPGYLLGISEFQEPEALFYEAIALRNLRLDAVTLATLPAFTKLREVGLPELQRRLSPGGIIDVGRPDAIKKLIDGYTVPSESYREIDAIKGEIDDTNATGPNVRGATSTIGRVSATESQGRLNQALTRMKLAAILIDEDMAPSVRQWLSLWYQFAPADLRVKVGGEGDGLITVNKSELIEAMQYDFRFRGATRALDRALTVQQLTQFGKDFKELLAPPELRALMKQTFETLGIRGVSKIITDKYTKILEVKFNQSLIAGAQTGPDGQPIAPQVPPSVPLGQANALAQEGGQGEVPPGAEGAPAEGGEQA